VLFRDGNYAERTGWKEVIALAGTGFTLRGSSVPSSDQSRELTVYPTDTIPPQDTEARFTVVPRPGSATAPLPEAAAVASGPGAPASATPRDAFTEVIASPDLGPGLVVMGLAIAAVFGALHGLSPGHGKAMVAAYLVGARGTAGQAVFLGGVVTVTHTLGVFALGLATLLASRYVVPERLYPMLSALSGLMICGVGGRLLYLRIRRLLRPRPPAAGAANHHHHLPSGPVTVRGLLALGISGGLIPCPSALVVLLAAVALHRVAFGMLLITAFSLGLAGVLMALGLIVVYARQWLERMPVSAALLRRVPIASAGVITLIGVGLLVRTLGGGGP
jgi:ABC-type nickel/cobalt efflux system permease component RcnA